MKNTVARIDLPSTHLLLHEHVFWMGCCCKKRERKGEETERRREAQEGKGAGKWRAEKESCITMSNVNPCAPRKQLKSASALTSKQTFLFQRMF